ncbi:hypothetical protein G7043_13270 [Lentzea sp. NEAU-D13]|uniref:Uncharacterized protein n=1 Tax=Lentzea alba TaxID=2714351 RepID=A0A7C9VMQ0_9PSEU|nr:hypothetical protein [Lentzea alba]NGY59894.1 hypothetical protein [Lentzea alba]
MDPEYRYYAISSRGNVVGIGPTQVCRRWVDETGKTHDEVYVNESGWTPTTELAEAESGGRGTEAHVISPVTASAFVDVQEGRGVSYDPVDGKYDHFAWLDDDKSSLDDAWRIIRTWTSPQGYHLENTYTIDSGWVRSHVREDVQDARKGGWLMPITDEDAERYKEIVAARRRQA